MSSQGRNSVWRIDCCYHENNVWRCFGKCNSSANDIIVVFISAVDVREKHIRMHKSVIVEKRIFCLTYTNHAYAMCSRPSIRFLQKLHLKIFLTIKVRSCRKILTASNHLLGFHPLHFTPQGLAVCCHWRCF